MMNQLYYVLGKTPVATMDTLLRHNIVPTKVQVLSSVTDVKLVPRNGTIYALGHASEHPRWNEIRQIAAERSIRFLTTQHLTQRLGGLK